MVWWLEQIEASGYNKYVVLKMTHFLEWEIDGTKQAQWAYFFGPGSSTISDTVKSSTGKSVYNENNNLHMFITTQNETINRDLYFEVTQGNITQAYVVTEFDINSTPGVNYVSVDPVLIRPKAEVPEKTPDSSNEEFYWLGGIK